MVIMPVETVKTDLREFIIMCSPLYRVIFTPLLPPSSSGANGGSGTGYGVGGDLTRIKMVD
jgi:hypothetical protein